MRRAMVLLVLAVAGAGVTACASGTAPAGPGGATSAVAHAATPGAAARVAAAPRTTAPVTSPQSTRPPATSNPCEHNASGKLVKVSLSRQRMYLCTATTLSFISPVTSGMRGQYTETPTGRFHIQGVTRNTSLTLIDGSSFTVKYWIPFDAPLFGFHDSSWQRFPYGSPKYRTQGSHGCVHLPLAAIRHLAQWAPAGTPVIIR